jgi:hypothetical protein
MIDLGLRGQRVRAQLLHRPRLGGVVETVRWMLAVQAQDITASPLALRARMAGTTVADVVAAREDRSVVRFWGPRGTIHLAAAEDLPWLMPLVKPSATDSLRRLSQLGVETTEADAARKVGQVMSGRGPVTKAELGELLGAEGQAIVHLAALAARAGLVVMGPDRPGKPTYVHTGDWLGGPVVMETDRDRALAELARRYLRAHGPAGPRDLAAWSGLPLRDAAQGWQRISGEMVESGPGLWTLGPVPEPAEAEPVVRLLPIWDEFMLGWADRDWQAPESYKPVLHSGQPVVVVDGEVAAVWRPRRTTGRLDITLEPLRALDSAALAAEADDIGRFLGRTVRIT